MRRNRKLSRSGFEVALLMSRSSWVKRTCMRLEMLSSADFVLMVVLPSFQETAKAGASGWGVGRSYAGRLCLKR